MRKTETGIGGMQLVLAVATIGVTCLVTVPSYKAHAHKEIITATINLAGDPKRKVAHFLKVTNTFPRSNKEAKAMVWTRDPKPEFIRDIRIKPDRAGETVLIRVVLSDGVIQNPTGERQYIYFAGSRAHDGKHAIEWRCGARGLETQLLPEECKG